jgi:hypothetical protein
MTELATKNLVALKSALPNEPLSTALPKTVGGCSVAGGFWRFFSERYPETGGIFRWNSTEFWRQAWPGLSSDLFFFGEDIFGNQLTLVPDRENVFLWNHENQDLADLLLDPATLFETVLQSGVHWIDFYTSEMLAIGRARLLDVPENCHLHWTQPLILAGAVAMANTSVLEAVSHLKFHGELWVKLRDLPPGTEVIIKPGS